MMNPRLLLEQLCTERGESLASLSRMIGRNDAYIQQYLRKGTPRQLNERERRTLARYFQIPESVLGGMPEDEDAAHGELVPLLRIPVRTAAGPGKRPVDEGVEPYMALHPRLLRSVTNARPDNLSIIRIEGDSMLPTLGAGDDVLFDLSDGSEQLRDGIYVLRVDGALLVKRLAIHPVGRRVTVQSDNPAYSDVPDCALDDIECVGRVIWAGRKIA